MTKAELEEIAALRILQSDHTRWFSREEFDRLHQLTTQQFQEDSDLCKSTKGWRVFDISNPEARTPSKASENDNFHSIAQGSDHKPKRDYHRTEWNLEERDELFVFSQKKEAEVYANALRIARYSMLVPGVIGVRTVTYRGFIKLKLWTLPWIKEPFHMVQVSKFKIYSFSEELKQKEKHKMTLKLDKNLDPSPPLFDYSVFFRYGSGHGRYAGKVKAENSKKAFKAAIEKYFDATLYDKYTAFWVQAIDHSRDGIEAYYGYDIQGQREAEGFRSNGKWMIDKILEDKR